METLIDKFLTIVGGYNQFISVTVIIFALIFFNADKIAILLKTIFELREK